MPVVGSYHLHLYCENQRPSPFFDDDSDLDSIHEFDEFPHEYADENKLECFRQARKDGWKICRDRRAYCPKCSGKRPKE